jgi:hypothetical protein
MGSVDDYNQANYNNEIQDYLSSMANYQAQLQEYTAKTDATKAADEGLSQIIEMTGLQGMEVIKSIFKTKAGRALINYLNQQLNDPTSEIGKVKTWFLNKTKTLIKDKLGIDLDSGEGKMGSYFKMALKLATKEDLIKIAKGDLLPLENIAKEQFIKEAEKRGFSIEEAKAQYDKAVTDAKTRISDIKQGVEQQISAAREEVKQKYQGVKDALEQQKLAIKNELDAKRQELERAKTELEQRANDVREQATTEAQQKLNEAKGKVQQVQQDIEDAQSRLKAKTDEVKQQLKDTRTRYQEEFDAKEAQIKEGIRSAKTTTEEGIRSTQAAVEETRTTAERVARTTAERTQAISEAAAERTQATAEGLAGSASGSVSQDVIGGREELQGKLQQIREQAQRAQQRSQALEAQSAEAMSEPSPRGFVQAGLQPSEQRITAGEGGRVTLTQGGPRQIKRPTTLTKTLTATELASAGEASGSSVIEGIKSAGTSLLENAANIGLGIGLSEATAEIKNPVGRFVADQGTTAALVTDLPGKIVRTAYGSLKQTVSGLLTGKPQQSLAPVEAEEEAIPESQRTILNQPVAEAETQANTQAGAQASTQAGEAGAQAGEAGAQAGEAEGVVGDLTKVGELAGNLELDTSAVDAIPGIGDVVEAGVGLATIGLSLYYGLKDLFESDPSPPPPPIAAEASYQSGI